MKNVRIITDNGLITGIDNCGGIEIITDGAIERFDNCEILPGLTDSHCHVWGLGMMNSGMDISGKNNARDTIALARQNNFMRGNWVVGRGWNNESWENKSLPDKSATDEIFPLNPLALTRVDGHAMWCNSKALEAAGINHTTIEPDGGKILKDGSGNPTGILIDNAMNLIEKLIPAYSAQQLEEFIFKGLDISMKAGLTAVHDMDVSPEMIDIYHRLNNQGKLPIRVYAYASCQNNEAFEYNINHYKSEMFTVQGIKLFADGALGSYGAAMLDEYNDKPGERGLLILDSEMMLQKILKADDSGLDTAIHAIGDRANHEVLDACQKLRELRPETKSKLRIEHAQIVDKTDLKRFKELGVIASVQPIHFVSDSEMALKRLGSNRLANSGYPWQSLWDPGAMMIGGSDFPIESHNPFKGINAFTGRENSLDISEDLLSEKLDIDSALKCYTSNPYRALGINNIGELRIGYKADFIIFEGSYHDSIPEIKASFINGKRIY